MAVPIDVAVFRRRYIQYLSFGVKDDFFVFRIPYTVGFRLLEGAFFLSVVQFDAHAAQGGTVNGDKDVLFVQIGERSVVDLLGEKRSGDTAEQEQCNQKQLFHISIIFRNAEKLNDDFGLALFSDFCVKKPRHRTTMPTFFAMNSKKIAASNFLGLFIVRSLELKKNGFSIAQ